MIVRLFLVLIVQLIDAETFFEFEDIPIEHFEHEDAKSDAFDVELMPRSSRSLFHQFGLRNPPKSSQLQPSDSKLTDFHKLFQNIPAETFRKKRNVRLNEDILKKLGKPLEISHMTTENFTEMTTSSPQKVNKRNTLAINDFIRFKRASELDDLNKDSSGEDVKSDSEPRWVFSNWWK